MATDYDDITTEHAEGRAVEGLRQRATYGAGSRGDLPTFYRFVVLETIFDPQIVDQTKIEYWQHDLGVSNIKYGVVPPRNAIIAVRARGATGSGKNSPMILYPFFPPTLSFPCKPGEHVWVMFEDQTGTKNDLGFWFCRIVYPGFVEDVNHTHPPRVWDPSFTPGIKEIFDGKDQPEYEFRNGSVKVTKDGERVTNPADAPLDGGDDIYKSLMTESDGGIITHYEPVPRYRKRPGEYVLEGTNNTLIVLGRDRQGPAATYIEDPDRGLVPEVPIDDVQDDGAGMIDLVAGRGQTPDTLGTIVQNDLPASELGKGSSELSSQEGDPDLDSDRSRIRVSQKTPIDINTNLSGFNEEFAIGDVQGTDDKPEASSITDDLQNDPSGDGAILLKTDKLRLIARSDVEILVTNYTREQDGRMTSQTDTSKFAAIVIKANGDIIMRPAEQGYIKLGGDEADKALVCTDFPAQALDGQVLSTTPPILTTMGGQFAGTNIKKQGMYASKILVVGKK